MKNICSHVIVLFLIPLYFPWSPFLALKFLIIMSLCICFIECLQGLIVLAHLLRYGSERVSD
uniref:ENTH domain-containing protein n=1 Tax=Mesocestoides corti TaxID=53468 RepID=A0A5K3FLT4_MESCO